MLNCGVLTAAINIKNQSPIQTLHTGDVIMAGDFPVKLLQVSGNGNFTGSGYVTIPIIGQANVKVRFASIGVNTDKQLISGIIKLPLTLMEGRLLTSTKYLKAANLLVL